MDSLFNSKISSDGPGAGILIRYDGQEIISKGYGLRDLETGEKIGPETNFRLGSVSKQFTALAALSLVEEGKLRLEDTVGNILQVPALSQISVAQLIHHTSGLAHYEEYFFHEWDTTKIVENKHILDWYKNEPEPEFAPGEKWEYCNGGYNLLATVVEKVSGQGFAEYARKNIFEKLGMEHTTYFNLAEPTKIEERAFCYEKSEGKWKKVDGSYLNGCLGEGAVYTSLNDFSRYAEALRNKEIFSEEVQALIFSVSPVEVPFEKEHSYSFNSGKSLGYAKGWFIDKDVAHHTGTWFGQRSMVVRGLEQPFMLALFMNLGDSDLRKELIDNTYKLFMEYLDNR
ncbi:serine hydrolase domain-containing protein [Pontixanthobacter gangjinensis]|nr:serine hydrolase domain-containing protein [Christiangramia aestuarii]